MYEGTWNPRAHFLIDSGGQGDLVQSVLADQAVLDLAVLGRDHHRLIAADKACAGKNDGFQQIAFGADFADVGQIGPDVAPEIADGMARRADGFRVLKHGLPAADVSGGKLA